LAAWRYSDHQQQFGMPGPMLDPIAGVLLILGLGYALRHLARPGAALVLAWAAGYVVAGMLTDDPPVYQRLVGISLPAALLGGLALERGLARVMPSRSRGLATLATGLAVVALSGALNWQAYLAWASDPRNASDTFRIARFLQAQPAEYRIVLIDSA